MKGDFARAIFDPLRRMVRVLMQQGRVTLDSDAPEPQPDPKKPSPTPAADGQAASNTHLRKPD